MAIHLLVVDDHPVVRVGVRQMMSETDIRVVGEAAGGKQAVEQAKRLRPDVVLLDVRMPEVDGLRALGEIKRGQPKLPVLMFSAYHSPTYIARSVALKASGFITKDVDRDRLIAAILEVAGGGTAWLPDHLRRASGPVIEPDLDADLQAPLTHRELEVLKQLSLGLTNKEIAEALGISYETVKEHVQHILRKLGVSDRTQAAVWAVRSGLA